MSIMPIQFYLQKTLPAVFDDSLTYYEAVAKLVAKVNEIVSYVEEIEQRENEYTDAQINNLKNQIDETIAQLNSDYESFSKTVSDKLNGFQNTLDITLNNQYMYIDSEIAGVNSRTDTAIANNNVYIFDRISKDLIDLKVINYFTGEIVPIQEMFDYLCQFHLTNAITYKQLASREKTYEQLANLNITYTQLAINGGSLITV